MPSNTSSLYRFSRLSLLIVGCVVTLLGAGFAYSVQAADLQVVTVSVDKVDALGNAAEDVRSFGVTFNKPVAKVSLSIEGFFYKAYSASTSSIYISPGDWTKKLNPNTTYKYTITGSETGNPNDPYATYSGTFTTSNFTPAKPDFVILGLDFPENPRVGEEIAVAVRVQNIGGQFSGIGGLVVNPLFNTGAFSISSSEDWYVTQRVTTWLQGGIDTVWIRGHFVRSGQFLLDAMYDNGYGITESDETNNTKTANIFVQPNLSWQLIKSSSSPAVYWYEKDLRARYTYPDEATYRTWWSNFNNITVLSDADMATIPLKGIVRVKPGSMMVKIKTDPKVYAVDLGGTLRWVKTEELARVLFGAGWNTRIIDLDVSLFGKYRFGSDISMPTDYSSNFSDVTTGSVLN